MVSLKKSQYFYIWAVLREKVLNVLSRCHTKRRTGTRGRAHPSFGITPTFQNFLKNEKSVSYQKKGGYDNDSGH